MEEKHETYYEMDSEEFKKTFKIPEDKEITAVSYSSYNDKVKVWVN